MILNREELYLFSKQNFLRRGEEIMNNDKGGSGVKKEIGEGRECYYGCLKGKKFKNKPFFMCWVDPEDCIRDGKNYLSLTKDGSLMG